MGNVHRLSGAPNRSLGEVPSFGRAALTSAGLSLLFLVVYGGCNWLSARRGVVATINFEWEQRIPFLPLMIPPYMSIDLFFLAAPFLCRNERELSLFSKRTAAAIVVAGSFFLLLPFRFAYPRPHPSGWLGALFDWFRGIDAPYNLFPSLHVALCLLLANLYVRRSRGFLRGALIVWFVLIGLSAVFTWQHHLLDVAGGLGLAVGCFYFVRE
jgi:membrane-associated phospholipid phosphatase